MSKAIPMIQKYMSTTPFSIEANQSLAEANDLMHEKTIRHLPVMRDGALLGILTDRDLKLALGIRGVDAAKTLVQEIAVEEPFITNPDSPVDQVVNHMAEKRIGSALIVQNHKLVGIFTSTDALRILGEVLRERHH